MNKTTDEDHVAQVAATTEKARMVELADKYGFILIPENTVMTTYDLLQESIEVQQYDHKHRAKAMVAYLLNRTKEKQSRVFLEAIGPTVEQGDGAAPLEQPGEGYRYLEEGEVVQDGDEVDCSRVHQPVGRWKPTARLGAVVGGQRTIRSTIYRRKLA